VGAPPGAAPRVSPRVSVVVPVWNAAATLAETIASVQAQTAPDWEMLLVDDGSRDGSRALAEAAAAADPRLRVVGWRDNRGAAAARNAGIRAARGRFIAFLDADDLWRPEKLAVQLAALEAGAPFVFSSYRRIDAAGRPLGIVRAPARISYRELLRGNAIGCLTAIYDREALGRVEMPDLRRRQDFGLWLLLLERTPHATGLPEVLADYRVRRGSLSADKLAALRDNWAFYRGFARLSPGRALAMTAANALHALAKRGRGLPRRGGG
jgi:teichuronic acid biosynthesis glycosyltransferase TuaG